MKSEPLVSVLMTSYNREKYIAKAIESVLASIYTNFELIIVDDGSLDSTMQISKSFEAIDRRVRVYKNEKNLGDYPNRNQAAFYAKGVYIKYVDADDYIYPWGLGAMVEMMEQFPTAGWGICSLDQFTEMPFPVQLLPKQCYEFNYAGGGIFHRAPLSSIIKKSVFDESGGFKNIRMAGDTEMWHRLGQKYSLVVMPKGIVWYRKHGEQEMNDFFKYKLVYEEIKVRYLRDSNCPLDYNVAKRIILESKRRVVMQIFKDIIRLRTKNIAFYFACIRM